MLYCDYCSRTIKTVDKSYESEECKKKCRFCEKCFDDLTLKNDEKSKLCEKFEPDIMFCCPCCGKNLYVLVEIPAKD